MDWVAGKLTRIIGVLTWTLVVMFSGPCSTLRMFIHEDSGPIGRLLTGKIRDSEKKQAEKSGERRAESRQEGFFFPEA